MKISEVIERNRKIEKCPDDKVRVLDLISFNKEYLDIVNMSKLSKFWKKTRDEVRIAIIKAIKKINKISEEIK